MAHVGKDFPTLIRHDLSLFGTYKNSPPYRMRLVVGASSGGSLTIPWRNVEVMSEEPDVNYADATVAYKFINPSDSSFVIDLEWKLVWPVALQHIPNNLRIQTTERFLWNDVVYARQIDLHAGFDLFLSTPFTLQRFSEWAESVDRALVDYQLFLNFNAARWSDVPDYHPRQPDHS